MENAEQHIAQAAALDAEISAAANPAPVNQLQPGAAAPGGVDILEEARNLLKFCVVTLAPLYPSIEPIYTDRKIEDIAKALAPVMAKYDLTFAGFFEKWGPEINLIIVLVPVIGETVKAVRYDNAKRKADAEAERQEEEDGNSRPG